MSFVNKLFSLTILLSVLATFTVFSCQKSTSSGKPQKKLVVFRTALQMDPSSMDPVIASVDLYASQVIMNLFEPLFIYSPQQNKMVPDLATGYTVSKDGLVYTIHIRDDACWSDGTPVTADDAIFSILRTINPENGSGYASDVAFTIKNGLAYYNHKVPASKVGLHKVDEKTFQVTLVQPISYFISMFNNPMFDVMPKAAITKYGSQWMKKDYLTNGAFEFVKYVPHDKVILKKNPRYWDAKNVKIDKLIFYIITNVDTAYQMYQNHELDMNDNMIPLANLPIALKSPDAHKVTIASTFYIDVNTDKPGLTSPLVRHAISLAIDRKTLSNQILKGLADPAYNFVPPSVGTYHKIAPTTGSFNPTLARHLLAQAGYPDGRHFPSISYTYSNTYNNKIIAEYIQQQLKQNLNINITLNSIDWKVYLSSLRKKDFDLARYGWVADYMDPVTFLNNWTKSSNNNFTSWTNKKYDQYLNSSTDILDQDKRNTVLASAEKILLQALPTIPLYNTQQLILLNTRAWGGFYPNPSDLYQYKDFYPITASSEKN